MTWILVIDDVEGRNLLVASVISGELVSELKRWATERGYRVEVKEQAVSKVVNS